LIFAINLINATISRYPVFFSFFSLVLFAAFFLKFFDNKYMPGENTIKDKEKKRKSLGPGYIMRHKLKCPLFFQKK